MTFLMMSVCPVCHEVALPLPGWRPKETVNPDGSITVEGTPCYCACTPETAQPNSLAPRGS